MYFYDQKALDEFCKTLSPDSMPQLQRFKGLGEMMQDVLENMEMTGKGTVGRCHIKYCRTFTKG